MPGHRVVSLKTRRVLGGLSISELARRAHVTVRQILNLESGGNCRPNVTQYCVDALGPPVTVTSSSVADPSVITVAAHSFQTGDAVALAGHAGSTPNINSTHTVTRINATTFSIPVNVTGGGTGGTATLQPESLGIRRLG